MNNKILSNTILLFKNIILKPKHLFINIKSDEFIKEIDIIFIFSAVVTLIKSFMVQHETFTYSFYKSEFLNWAIEFLNNAQVSLFVIYLSYFIVLYIIFIFCRLFKNNIKYKNLALSFMAISAIGILMQIIFLIFSIFISEYILDICFKLILVWIVYLSIMAVKLSQDLTLLQAVICFMVPALPFTLFINVLSIAPYLAWLTEKIIR
jgi:hypothetical protein